MKNRRLILALFVLLIIVYALSSVSTFSSPSFTEEVVEYKSEVGTQSQSSVIVVSDIPVEETVPTEILNELFRIVSESLIFTCEDITYDSSFDIVDPLDGVTYGSCLSVIPNIYCVAEETYDDVYMLHIFLESPGVRTELVFEISPVSYTYAHHAVHHENGSSMILTSVDEFYYGDMDSYKNTSEFDRYNHLISIMNYSISQHVPNYFI